MSSVAFYHYFEKSCAVELLLGKVGWKEKWSRGNRLPPPPPTPSLLPSKNWEDILKKSTFQFFPRSPPLLWRGLS
jgi:hypothetical protein